MQNSELIQTIKPLLNGDSPQLEAALRSIAEAFGAATGTLHKVDDASAMLLMVASLGLPEALKPMTARIPFGKGIAGLCAERREPVTLCNLQTDTSGQAKPNARQTGVAGAIAVPVCSAGGALVGVLGIGKIEAHDYSEDEQRVLLACGQLIARALAS